MEIKIKNCPFCGKEPNVTHTVALSDGSRALGPSYDIKIRWAVRCEYCNIEKASQDASRYAVNKSGGFELVTASFTDEIAYDARVDAINSWNDRKEDEVEDNG